MSMSGYSVFYRLNCPRVRGLIHEQNLKKYWVAEEAGIHKTTLRRWLSGRIDRVREENVLALARVLSTTGREIADPVFALPTLPALPRKNAFLD